MIKLIALGILAVVGILFILRYARRGKVTIKSIFGEVTAEGENLPPPANIPGGVSIKDSEAGRDVKAKSETSGGVNLEKVKAGRDIQADHSGANPPPKA